jgi:hypothetical protein
MDNLYTDIIHLHLQILVILEQRDLPSHRQHSAQTEVKYLNAGLCNHSPEASRISEKVHPELLIPGHLETNNQTFFLDTGQANTHTFNWIL